MNPATMIALFFQTPPPTSTGFLTIETLFTFAGSTTAVFVVTSVVHGLFPKVSPRWFAALLSLVLMLVAIHVNQQKYCATNILLAFINAAIVYAASVGVNNITSVSAMRLAGNATSKYLWWS
jgi:hypothetical protein